MQHLATAAVAAVVATDAAGAVVGAAAAPAVVAAAAAVAAGVTTVRFPLHLEQMGFPKVGK